MTQEVDDDISEDVEAILQEAAAVFKERYERQPTVHVTNKAPELVVNQEVSEIFEKVLTKLGDRPDPKVTVEAAIVNLDGVAIVLKKALQEITDHSAAQGVKFLQALKVISKLPAVHVDAVDIKPIAHELTALMQKTEEANNKLLGAFTAGIGEVVKVLAELRDRKSPEIKRLTAAKIRHGDGTTTNIELE
jgi:hypothetical protein